MQVHLMYLIVPLGQKSTLWLVSFHYLKPKLHHIALNKVLTEVTARPAELVLINTFSTREGLLRLHHLITSITVRYKFSVAAISSMQ